MHKAILWGNTDVQNAVHFLFVLGEFGYKHMPMKPSLQSVPKTYSIFSENFLSLLLFSAIRTQRWSYSLGELLHNNSTVSCGHSALWRMSRTYSSCRTESLHPRVTPPSTPSIEEPGWPSPSKESQTWQGKDYMMPFLRDPTQTKMMVSLVPSW